MDALTQPTYRDALRVASQAGDEGVTVADLVLKLGSKRAWAHSVLNELEAQGYVKGSPRKGERRPGLPTVYRIQHAKVRVALDELAAWILGQDPPVSGIGKTVDEEGGL